MADLLQVLRADLSDRYAIEREIGSGGMAHVFLARDVKHHRHVAIKILRPDVGGSIGADRFIREIDVAAKLSHPHILPLHDSGQAAGLLYYVMPYVEGESLRDRLVRGPALPVREALSIAADVAGALAYAHRSGVVHRDIKPENILLSAGYAVVADFGIAHAISAAGGGDRLTQTGVSIGSVHYMSPEQAVGDAVDGRSDIYSLGCVLYEMLAGEPPFSAPTPQAVMARRFSEDSPTLARTREDVPTAITNAVARAMAKEPENRFPTGEAFRDALLEASATLYAPTAERSPPAKRERMRRSAIALGSVLLLAAGSWALWRRDALFDSPLPQNRIAVLPFAVHGGLHQRYLSEGIVDLLSRNLEGVDDLHCVDAGTVMAALRDRADRGAPIDTKTGQALVRRVGAGGFILGSVTSSGSRIRIHAQMYSGADNRPGATATIEGDSAQILSLVDRLSADLLVQRRPGATQRLVQTAAITTHSLPALKLFLNAEQRLRAGALDSAIAGFQRAIAEDSTFALAYYRLAIAAGWAERHALSTESVNRALAVRGRLTPRDQRLVAAYAAFRRGTANEAERAYRALLEDFPDDVEAEFQLGDVLFQYNPLRGRPRLEARPMLDRVLAYDPGFL